MRALHVRAAEWRLEVYDAGGYGVWLLFAAAAAAAVAAAVALVVGWLMGEHSIWPGDKCQNDASLGRWNKFLVKLNLL